MTALLLTLLVLIQGDAGTISGRLLTSASSPAAGVRVALSKAADTAELIAITQTDADGRYRFENIAAGSYYIVGGLVKTPTYSSDAINLTARSVVEAPVLRLLDGSGGFTAKGRVLLEGLPAGQSFRLEIHFNEIPTPRVLGTGRKFIATVAQDGSFETHGLVSGTYNVMFFPNVNVGVMRNPVTIDHDVDDLEFRVPATALQATLEGTAKVDGVAPLPPIGIELLRKDSPVGSYRGWGFLGDKLSIPLVLAGEYEVKVTGVPQGYFVKALTAGSANVLTQGLKVSYPTTPKLEVTLGVNTPMPGVRVLGQITNNGDVTLVTNISISGSTPSLTLRTQPRPDGSFEFPMVPPGTYTVEFMPTVDTTPTARSITVGSDNPTRVEIPLQVRRKITATMTARPSNRVFPFIQIGGKYVRATFGGRETWEFLNVPPGTYQLVLGEQSPQQPRLLNKSLITVVVADKDVAVKLNGRP